jgi:hypothetical protein
MCSRFLNNLPTAEIARIFRTSNPLPNYLARYKLDRTMQRYSFNACAKPS